MRLVIQNKTSNKSASTDLNLWSHITHELDLRDGCWCPDVAAPCAPLQAQAPTDLLVKTPEPGTRQLLVH